MGCDAGEENGLWIFLPFGLCALVIVLHQIHRASLMAQRVKSLPAMQETQVQSLDQEDPLEEEMATHSSILVWRIPWTEEAGRLQSTGSQRFRHDWSVKQTTPTYKMSIKVTRILVTITHLENSFFLHLFLIEGWFLYSIVLISGYLANISMNQPEEGDMYTYEKWFWMSMRGKRCSRTTYYWTKYNREKV